MLTIEEMRIPNASIAGFLFDACGTWLIGLGLYFMFLRRALLPEDIRYMGAVKGELQSIMPGLSGLWDWFSFIGAGSTANTQMGQGESARACC